MTVSSGRRMQFFSVLKSRRFARIWAGQAISNLGDGIFRIALAWQVLLMTHSGTAMGILLIASTVPQVAFAIFGGVAADRLPRRLIILWSDGGRAIIVLLVSILGFTGYLQFWHLVVEALVFGLVDGFFNPSILAITPDLVEKDELTSANALNSLSSNFAQLLGPVLGAALITVIGPMGAFLANAVSFFISFLFLVSVEIPERHMLRPENAEGVEGIEKQKGLRGVIADVQEGLGYVRRSTWIWVTIVSAGIGNIGIMATVVAQPKLVSDTYGQGAWLLGILSVGFAVGSFISIPLISLATRLKRRGILAYLGLSMTSVGIIILGLPFTRSAPLIIAPLANILVGFGLAFFNTIYFTILHETIPNDKLGRVLSLDLFASFATIPIGEALGGVMADHIGPAQVFLIFGTFNFINTLIPLLVRGVRQIE